VNSGKPSAVPGIHGLQEVIAALITYLAQDDAVGTMPERSGHKLAWRDCRLAGQEG
jgi:hypothetical protein